MPDTTQKKLCYSIKGAIAYTDFSRSYLFEAIRTNQIKSFKRGSRRFILHKDLVSFVDKVASEAETK